MNDYRDMGWYQSLDEQGLYPIWYKADGTPATDSDFAQVDSVRAQNASNQAEQRQSSIATGTAMGARALTPDEQAAYEKGQFTPPAGMGFYNAGNGLTLLAPIGDPNFMPQPKDTGLGWEIAAGHPAGYREGHGGLSIMAMPFLAAGAAALGAGGGAGAGAAEGTAGTGAVDASTGLYAGESANAGAGTYGTVGGGATGASAAGAGTLGTTSETGTLTGNAASDTGGTVGEGYLDDFTGQWVDGGSGTDPSTGLFSGESGTAGSGTYGTEGGGATGYTASDGTLVNSSTVQEVARQLGITPAAALRYLMSAGGGLAAAGLGAYASNKQAGSLQALNQQYMNMGAPSRGRYEASYQPGFTMANDPGYTDALNQASKATLHGLSVQGNPAGSPNAWNQSMTDLYQKTAYPALQNYRNQNAATGGIASFSAAAPAAATGAIGAQGNVYNAIGGGLNDIFNPPKSLAQQLAELKQSGLYA